MVEEEKTWPRCCEHQGQAMAGSNLRQSIPANNYKPGYRGLQALLPRGRANAVTAAHLAALTGVDPREATREIRKMRLRGIPVCASVGENPGYWISDDAKELAQYCKTLDRRLKNIRATREAIGEALIRMTGQIELFDVEVRREQEEAGISEETL